MEKGAPYCQPLGFARGFTTTLRRVVDDCGEAHEVAVTTLKLLFKLLGEKFINRCCYDVLLTIKFLLSGRPATGISLII
jgi:hypothetical protein